MTLKATVEKAENGFIVDFGQERRVALDELGLAAVFEDWPSAPEPLRDAADIQDRMRAATREALQGTEPDWPSTVPDRHNDNVARLPAETTPSAPAIVRTPVADDGTEYPPVRQEGPNHFVVECPSHGEKRMERQGTNWRCMGQTNKQACTVVVPRSVLGRLFNG